MRRSGSAYLPLHGGKAPRWLFEKMVKLSRIFIELAISEVGNEALLDMFASPYWFQSFGSFLGFDWHSSGLTTTTLGALKVALSDMTPSIGLFIAGGKGKTMRNTPREIEHTEKYLKVNPDELKIASKIAAKVDSAWIQDGYNLYHHTILYTPDGQWVVIQQGMNEEKRYARRYHWHHSLLKTDITLPHSGIKAEQTHKGVFNLVSPTSLDNKRQIVSIFKEVPISELEKTLKLGEEERPLFMPPHHQVKLKISKNVKKIILSTYENPPKDITDLATSHLGPASIRALSMAATLIYGSQADFTDPAVYSYAHGGKDGYPYPVDLKLYENTISVLEKINRLSPEARQNATKVLRELHKLFKN